jgi:hypothetical protein
MHDVLGSCNNVWPILSLDFICERTDIWSYKRFCASCRPTDKAASQSTKMYGMSLTCGSQLLIRYDPAVCVWKPHCSMTFMPDSLCQPLAAVHCTGHQGASPPPEQSIGCLCP